MDATQIWYESDEINSCVTVGRVILLLDAVLLGCHGHIVDYYHR
jgi:hypothetical protein